jgi:hypothetical protein
MMAVTPDGKHKLVLIAGKPSHPPGMHEFRAGSILLENCLKSVPNLVVDRHEMGWVKAEAAFADHHAFTEADARRLLAVAQQHGARLVTTEKDWVRLVGFDGARGDLRERSRALAIELARLANDLKCTDVLLLSVGAQSQVCDYFLIASGTSVANSRPPTFCTANFAWGPVRYIFASTSTSSIAGSRANARSAARAASTVRLFAS